MFVKKKHFHNRNDTVCIRIYYVKLQPYWVPDEVPAWVEVADYQILAPGLVVWLLQWSIYVKLQCHIRSSLRTVLLNSTSKTFSMSKFFLGWIQTEISLSHSQKNTNKTTTTIILFSLLFFLQQGHNFQPYYYFSVCIVFVFFVFLFYFDYFILQI